MTIQLNPIDIRPFNPDTCIYTPTRPVEGVVMFDIATPSDTVDLPQYARWVKCGTSGTIVFMRWDGIVVSDSGPYIAGIWHPVYFKRILATGTTATQLLWGN